RELVRQPLPVASLRRLPDRAAVDVRVVDREAGVPQALALGVTFEVVRIDDGRAEAGRAGERAVAAAQATLGDLVPAGMVRARQEQLGETRRVELAAHACGGELSLLRRL